MNAQTTPPANAGIVSSTYNICGTHVRTFRLGIDGLLLGVHVDRSHLAITLASGDRLLSICTTHEMRVRMDRDGNEVDLMVGQSAFCLPAAVATEVTLWFAEHGVEVK